MNDIRRGARRAGFLAIFALTLAGAAAGSDQTPGATPKPDDPWVSFRTLAGRWQGAGDGTGGAFSIKTDIQFVLGGAFLQIKGEVRIPPSARHSQAIVGEDLAFVGYDAARKQYELRQFRSDGSFGRFACRRVLDEGRTFLFVGRPEEGAAGGPTWKVTYRLAGPQALSILIEQAPPDKDFEKVAAANLKRVR